MIKSLPDSELVRSYKLMIFSTEGEGNSYLEYGIIEKKGLESKVPRFYPQGSLQVM